MVFCRSKTPGSTPPSSQAAPNPDSPHTPSLNLLLHLLPPTSPIPGDIPVPVQSRSAKKIAQAREVAVACQLGPSDSDCLGPSSTPESVPSAPQDFLVTIILSRWRTWWEQLVHPPAVIPPLLLFNRSCVWRLLPTWNWSPSTLVMGHWRICWSDSTSTVDLQLKLDILHGVCHYYNSIGQKWKP